MAAVGGVQTITTLVGLTPSIPWVTGVAVLLFFLLLAAFLAYHDLYIHHIELIRQTPTSPTYIYLPKPRHITNKDVAVIMNLEQQMKHLHGHSDYDGIEAAIRYGVMWNDVMKQDCTKCGKPRNQKGDYFYE
jgi:hypothetical protein